MPNGTDVSIKIGVNSIGSQRNATIAENTAPIDISSKDDRDAEFLGGRYSATLTCDSLYVPTDTAYVALLAAMRAGTSVTVMRVEDAADVESIDGIVTGISNVYPDQDACVCSISIQLSGGWTSAP